MSHEAWRYLGRMDSSVFMLDLPASLDVSLTQPWRKYRSVVAEHASDDEHRP